MVRAILISAAFAAGLASSAMAQPRPPGSSLPIGGEVINPDWASRPSAEDMSRNFPPIGQAMQIPGNVVMQCVVSAAGATEQCTILTEKPLGIGFGEAALRLASLFRMKPRMIDGVATGGATVKIPIAFTIASSSASQPVASPSGPPPSPRVLDLARRAVAASGFGDGFERFFQQDQARLRQVVGSGAGLDAASLKARSAAFDAMQAGYREASPVLMTMLTDLFARTFTEAELTEMVAFYESAAGKAVRERTPAMGAQMQVGIQALMDAMHGAAVRTFCQQVDCLSTTQAAAPTVSGLPVDLKP